MTPLVSIITPTIRRPTLAAACHSVNASTHRPIEHLVVVDGPTRRAALPLPPGYGEVERREIRLGRCWTTPQTGPGAIACNVGWYLAKGDYLLQLGDDDLLLPSGLATLVRTLEERGADWAYGATGMIYGQRPMVPESARWVATCEEPTRGQVGVILFRAHCLKVSAFQPLTHSIPTEPEQDWEMLERWMAAGLKWARTPELVLLHHADHGGTA